MIDRIQAMGHPLAIFVQLTTACNAECINCPHAFTYGRRGSHRKGHMPPEVWEELLRQIRRARYSGQVGLYLHHEPLLVGSLYSKIRQVNETTDAFVVIATNGALLNAENRRLLIDAAPRQVHVNINSADKAQYEETMGLHFETTFENTRRFIEEARGRICIEINCPVLPGVDTQKLVAAFPGVHVNVEYWANSRGGLLPNVSAQGKGSRFKLGAHCTQPTVNFNVLWDGSVILCCMDWAHESKADFPSILDCDLFETYNGVLMRSVQQEFVNGDYSRYRMCSLCASEMGFTITKTRNSLRLAEAAVRPLS
jgi:hypothetical protein